jgi:hypothetical protein
MNSPIGIQQIVSCLEGYIRVLAKAFSQIHISHVVQKITCCSKILSQPSSDVTYKDMGFGLDTLLTVLQYPITLSPVLSYSLYSAIAISQLQSTFTAQAPSPLGQLSLVSPLVPASIFLGSQTNYPCATVTATLDQQCTLHLL